MSLSQHLPALQVVLPLMSAPLAVLLRRGGIAFVLVTAAAWISFAIAIALWLQVDANGIISYPIGNWEPPWGIEYRIDRLNSFMLVLVSGIAAVVLPYCRASIAREIPREKHYLFYAMVALCLTGLLGISITGDAFNIFVFLEISALSTYVLIAMGRDRRALTAAYQYLIMGSIGATFVVIGIGYLYLMTGTLNLADMAQKLAAIESSRPVLVALAFLTVGISLKVALFPLHQWLPNAYTYAPSAVSAFVAATATKVALYALIRFYFTVFGDNFLFDKLPLPEIMLLLSLLAMFVANFAAIFQDNLKRMFAYSSVGQMGYITLGLSFDSVHGLAASIMHLFNHGVAKGAIFMLIGGVVARLPLKQSETEAPTFARLAGLSRSMPATCFGIVVGGLSLIGVPGTAGFITKWHLVLAAIEQRQWWLVAAILLSSLLSVAYVWRFVEVAYFREPPVVHRIEREAPLGLLIPAWLMIAATIWFGFDTSFTVGSAMDAAQQLVRRGN